MEEGARLKTAVTTSATMPMAFRQQSICGRLGAVKKFISKALAGHPVDIGRDRGHPPARGSLDGWTGIHGRLGIWHCGRAG
jgi:hypothetical protein